jgi:aspartyl protease family protein
MSGFAKLMTIVVFGSIAATVSVLHLRDSKPAPASAAAAQPTTPRMAAPASPAQPAAGGNTAMLYADTRGHFHADIQVRGTPIRTLVDTGASLVTFSTEDAAKLGLRADASQRTAQFNTANGLVTAHLVRIPEMRLQGITVYDVDAAILPPGAMKGTLLGMSFMKKLASYESRGTSIVMRR